MQITSLYIHNFKSIKTMHLTDVENALILVGKNNAGKSSVLDAVRAVGGQYQITEDDFHPSGQNIEIGITLSITREDLKVLHSEGIVSQYKRYDVWEKRFKERLPSFQDGCLTFSFIANRNGRILYQDGFQKNNPYIPKVFPKIYYIDTERDISQIQEDLFISQEDRLLTQMRSDCCLFDRKKKCTHCFQCIGLINQKMPEELNAFEASKLFEYKLYHLNLDRFVEKVNTSFRKNGGVGDVFYYMNYDMNSLLKVHSMIYSPEHQASRTVEQQGKGIRSIYILSLLEAYVEESASIPCIIMMEVPEIYLHPELQKTAGDLLYKLSEKNQVMFTTHAPHLIFNFNSRQIRQIQLDKNAYSIVRDKTDIGGILNDLGHTAADLMDVNFVFIVEGKQDKSRLPLLLERYYSEVCDEDGRLKRIAIITTNSCTNIKTYANLKYMNQIYLKNQFLMIRDSDGKDPDILGKQLCRYYDERSFSDADPLPKVTRKNVLILKYYSFENYFLNPKVMVKLNLLKTKEEFYEILFDKWQEYLHRLQSGRHLTEILGRTLTSSEDIRQHMEQIKIYLRGHNLFDIFYGPYKKNERELLKKYIELAPREDFQDILGAIDDFIYFKSKRTQE